MVTSGTSTGPATAYARLQPDAVSQPPAGLAILAFRKNNVLVSEVAIPASPLVQSGRVYVEVNGPVNTGIAIANPNNQPAVVSFFFTSLYTTFGHGSFVIPANGKIAKFFSEPPFTSFKQTFGTFTFNSSVPVSAAALRGLTNERSEFLITTVPVFSPPLPNPTGAVVLPHYAAGEEWTTEVILINPSDEPITGTVEYLNSSGQAATIKPIGAP